MMCINAKAMPINNNGYYCHITTIELVLTNHLGFTSLYIMSLVINSLGSGDTHVQTHTRTNDPHRIDFKKPGAWFKNFETKKD